jgi:hypothetical protein
MLDVFWGGVLFDQTLPSIVLVLGRLPPFLEGFAAALGVIATECQEHD